MFPFFVMHPGSAFNTYVVEQSYGLASVNADFRGYVMLPSPLSQYKVSQFNNQVDAGRVRKLVEDTMTTLENEVNFSSYDHMLIIPAVHTTSGTGYGMVCYCANPGMLTPIQKKDRFGSIGRVGQYETVRSKGGKKFRGGVFVGAENANLGMYAHDYFHALGGLYEGRRFAP
jgi:M6 family metalloprotease-like protein